MHVRRIIMEEQGYPESVRKDWEENVCRGGQTFFSLKNMGIKKIPKSIDKMDGLDYSIDTAKALKETILSAPFSLNGGIQNGYDWTAGEAATLPGRSSPLAASPGMAIAVVRRCWTRALALRLKVIPIRGPWEADAGEAAPALACTSGCKGMVEAAGEASGRSGSRRRMFP